MGIYIRACFCVDRFLDQNVRTDLIEILSPHRCNVLGLPLINLGKWIDQKMIWNTENDLYAARLFQLYSTHSKSTMFSFDVDSLLFLPENKIIYSPGNELDFQNYKLLLSDIINYLLPAIGVVDYDADLLCGDLQLESLIGWGNYFSNDLISTMSVEEINILHVNVEELNQIDSHGILTFLHPLMANRAWTNRHKILESLMKSHIINYFK